MATILIVDDDRDSCEVLSRFLTRFGHQSICAHDGREAIIALTEKRPGLILLDLSMPVMDGIKFLEVLRSYIRWTPLPAIVISGVANSVLVERASELGVRRVFRKGDFQLEELLSAINEELPPPSDFGDRSSSSGQNV